MGEERICRHREEKQFLDYWEFLALVVYWSCTFFGGYASTKISGHRRKWDYISDVYVFILEDLFSQCTCVLPLVGPLHVKHGQKCPSVTTAYLIYSVPPPSLAVHKWAFGSLHGPSLASVLLAPNLSLCSFVVFYLFLDLHYGTEIKLSLVVHWEVNIFLGYCPISVWKPIKSRLLMCISFIRLNHIKLVILYCFYTISPSNLTYLRDYGYIIISKTRNSITKIIFSKKRGKIVLIYMVIKYSL